MSWYSFRPYVSAGERRRKAEQAAKKMAGKGRTLAPIRIDGRTIASTFWGKAWCGNLESYSDYENRLPRGRTYVRNGSVIDLQISGGKIEALVQGSDLYKIAIHITALPAPCWREFTRGCAGKVTNLLDLLQGRLSKEILADITAKGSGLFPAPKEIKLGCSCPDSAGMCKHIAAVLYGIGARLDTKPELFFTLRGVDMQDLITAASASAAAPIVAGSTADAFGDADLSEIFGVDIEASGTPGKAAASKKVPRQKKPAVPPAKASRKTRPKKPAARPAKPSAKTPPKKAKR